MIPADARPVGKFHVTADGDVYGPSGRKLRTYVQSHGYVTVSRWDPAKGYVTSMYVHRLVCEAFHGPPRPGAVTRHLNGDPSDNRAENLTWGTQAENLADRVAHGTANKGERHGLAKLTDDDVRAIRASTDTTGVELARRYGVSESCISRIRRRRYWSHV